MRPLPAAEKALPSAKRVIVTHPFTRVAKVSLSRTVWHSGVMAHSDRSDTMCRGCGDVTLGSGGVRSSFSAYPLPATSPMGGPVPSPIASPVSRVDAATLAPLVPPHAQLPAALELLPAEPAELPSGDSRPADPEPPSPLGWNTFALALWLTALVGIPLFLLALFRLDAAALTAMSPGVWLLGALVIIGETRPLIASKRYGQGGVTPSTAFTFAILFIWGPAPAIVLHGIASLLADFVERKEWWKKLFNVAQYSACIAAAWVALAAWGWEASPEHPHVLSAADLGPMVLSWTIYFVANNGLVSLVVALRNRSSFWDVFYEDFGYQVFSNVAVLVFSPLVALVTTTSPLWLPLVVPPMFAIYATTGMALEREHQANHDALTKLPNRKYLRERLQQALDDRGQ